MYVKQLVFIAGVVLTMSEFSQVMAAEQAPLVTEIINPDGLFNPAPYGFSHSVVASGAEKMAFIAGQGGEDENGNLTEDFGSQVRQAYKNLITAITAAGASPEHVTKLGTYVVDYDQSKLSIMTKELKAVFGDHLPAQTLVPVPRLALDGMLFEVDAIAVLK